MAGLAILLVGAALALIVFWLHRNQAKRHAESAERSVELPPLDNVVLPDFQQASDASTASPVSTAASAIIAPTAAPPITQPVTQPKPTAVVAAATPTPQPLAPAPQDSELSANLTLPMQPSLLAAAPPTAALVATLPNADATHKIESGSSWHDQLKQLKDQQHLDAALTLCQQQFPKTVAFQQAAIVLRLQLKKASEQHQDLTPLLSKLYRCAVLADLFRSGPSLKPRDPRTVMKSLNNQNLPYAQIGHQELKLLIKTDIKLLEQTWGQPQQHQHADAALGEFWLQLCAN